MARQWIRDLKEGDKVDAEVAVVRCSQGLANNGSPYLTLVVCDRTGRMPVKHWKPRQDEMDRAATLRYLRLRGSVTRWKDGCEIHAAGPLEPVDSPESEEDLLLCAPVPYKELRARLDSHIASVTDVRLQALLKRLFSEASKSEKFLTYPAAREMHHAYRYGLLQHTLEVADVVAAVAKCQEQWGVSGMWTDLAVTGALLHDIGKVDEFQEDGPVSYSYSERGSLLGHIVLGILRVARGAAMVRKEMGFSEELETHVCHLIASHHGRQEFGSPQPPMTVEAIVLSMADRVSAELYYAQEARAAAVDGGFRQSKIDVSFQGRGRLLFVGQHQREESVEPGEAGITVVREPEITYAVAEAGRGLPRLKLVTGGETAEETGRAYRLPLCGKIAAGQPLSDSAASDGDYLVDVRDIPGCDSGHYLLRVSGDSMTGDGIEDGDLILVRYQEEASSGQIVVANLDQRDVTVKRLQRQGDEVLLVSSNPAHAPILVADPAGLRLQGVVVGVVPAGTR